MQFFFLFCFFSIFTFYAGVDCSLENAKKLEKMGLFSSEVRYEADQIVELVVFADSTRKIQLEPYLACFPVLQRLVLRGLGLKKIPEALLKMNRLYELDLSNNSLTSLPETFTSLKYLKVLLLDQNLFTQFPLVVLKMNVQELHLAQNKITQIPQNIAQMQQLVILDLSANAFYGFPGILLVQMKNLRELYWQKNPDLSPQMRNYLKEKRPLLKIY